MLISLIALTASLALTGISDPDGVISTAPTGRQAVLPGATAPQSPDVPMASSQTITPHGLSTDEQIDRWIAQRSPTEKPFAGSAKPWMQDDRKIHGEVSAGIGTGDYSAYSASVSIPIGENGRVNLSYTQSKNSPYGYGYGYPGYGYGLGRRGLGYGDPFYFDRGFQERGIVYPGGSRIGPDGKEPVRLAPQSSVDGAPLVPVAND